MESKTLSVSSVLVWVNPSNSATAYKLDFVFYTESLQEQLPGLDVKITSELYILSTNMYFFIFFNEIFFSNHFFFWVSF